MVRNKIILLKILRLFILVVILAAIVVIAGIQFPKYAVRMAFFSVFLLIDIIYLPPFKKVFAENPLVIRLITGFIYWIPFALLVSFIVLSFLVPINVWLPFFRIYVPGVLVILYVGKAILIVFMLLGDMVLLPLNISEYLRGRRFRASFKWLRLKILVKAALLFSAVVMVLFFTGMVHWVYDFRVKYLTISMEDLPPSFNNLKIVQISDIHLGSWPSPQRLEEAVKMINDQNPDMIVFTGDIVNFSSAETYPFTSVLKQLHAPLGIYTVKGNHDYGDYISWKTPADKDKNIHDLNAFYKSIGWKLLDNQHQVITRGFDSIVLVGVENWSASKLYGKRGNLAKALKGAEQKGFKILLSHDPTHWDEEVSRSFHDIDLTLSGHTHAMQMGLESSSFRWSPAQWKFKEWAGLYEQDVPVRQYLYVNRGLGTVGYPGRIGIRPEITVIQLVTD
jgi:hypothetical protein